jgi:hypothetical protein
MAFFNQHSFTISGLVLLIVLSVLLFRDGVQPNDIIALGALLLGFVTAFLLFQPGESSLQEANEVVAAIGQDTPVLLEFQSNY